MYFRCPKIYMDLSLNWKTKPHNERTWSRSPALLPSAYNLYLCSEVMRLSCSLWASHLIILWRAGRYSGQHNINVRKWVSEVYSKQSVLYQATVSSARGSSPLCPLITLVSTAVQTCFMYIYMFMCLSINCVCSEAKVHNRYNWKLKLLQFAYRHVYRRFFNIVSTVHNAKFSLSYQTYMRWKTKKKTQNLIYVWALLECIHQGVLYRLSCVLRIGS
jgi:hypothetical protein